jgi:uncharacterized membrane protein
MTLREQVPKPLRGPVGFASLGIMLLGVTVGYILTSVGITLYFDLHPIEQGAVSAGEGIAVTAIGLVTLVVGYLGWRGFNYFAY